MPQISDVLATSSAHDIQLDVTKFKAFQLFIESFLHLTPDQQCELIIEEFYEDIITVLTTCTEFTKKFTQLRVVERDEIDGKNYRKDLVVSNSVLGCAVTPPATVPIPVTKSSKNKNLPSSGSRKNVPTNHNKEDIPDNNQNEQKTAQEIINELLGDCLSVASVCCDIYLNSNNSRSMREKHEGNVVRRKATEDRIVLRYVLTSKSSECFSL